MSRYEIAELEKELQKLNDAVADEEEVEDEATIAARKKNPEYRRFMEKIKQL